MHSLRGRIGRPPTASRPDIVVSIIKATSVYLSCPHSERVYIPSHNMACEYPKGSIHRLTGSFAAVMEGVLRICPGGLL
jgi:hypothetical protein